MFFQSQINYVILTNYTNKMNFKFQHIQNINGQQHQIKYLVHCILRRLNWNSTYKLILISKPKKLICPSYLWFFKEEH